jgi:CRISPR/Cas system-associated exonuclease Cas4 (RecB family)
MLLKTKGAKSEQKLAVTDKWEPCDYESTETYLRAIIDIIYVDGEVVHVQDWKTGQVYDSHKAQLDTYVAVAAAHHPEAKAYHARAVYIDQGIVSIPKITAAERVKPIRLLLDGRVKSAEEDTIFPSRHGSHCKWCDYSRKWGGPCAHG